MRCHVVLLAGVVTAVSVAAYGFSLPLPEHHRFIMALEALFGSLAVCVFGLALRRPAAPRTTGHKMLMVSLGALFGGDLLINSKLANLAPASEWVIPAGFACYFVLALSFPAFIWNHYVRAFEGADRLLLGSVSALSVVFMVLQLKYVVVPIESHTGTIGLFLKLCYYAFKVSSAACLGLLLPCAIRVTGSLDQFFLQSSVLLHLSGLVVYFYPLTLQPDGSAERSGAAWTIAVAGFCITAIAAAFDHPGWPSRPATLANWRSVRSLLSAAFLALLLTLVACLLANGICKVTTGKQLNALLLLTVGCWFAANWVATKVGSDIAAVNSALPDPVAIESNEIASVTLASFSRPIFYAELAELIGAYNAVAGKANSLLSQATIANQERITAKTAAQMAHDIRSPLAALKMLLPHLTKLDEDVRVLARTAVFRVEDIANQLLVERRAGNRRNAQEAQAAEILSLLENLVSEKRFQHRGLPNARIEAQVDSSVYGVFAAVDTTTLKRVLSNLVNNAVESLESGTITLSARPCQKGVALEIRDNGPGIAPHLLDQIRDGLAVTSKPDGNGIGLTHARQSIKQAGGDLSIESTVGHGTVVRISLPRQSPPPWFVRAIPVSSVGVIIALDDDASIHEVWKARLGAARIIHCVNSSAFREACMHTLQDKRLCLVDYELVGEGLTGIELAQQCGVGSQTILVTSHYEEPAVQAEAMRAGLRILPKGAALHAPMATETSQKRSACREARAATLSPARM